MITSTVNTKLHYNEQLLQDDVKSLFNWSKLVDLSFVPSKCGHIYMAMH